MQRRGNAGRHLEGRLLPVAAIEDGRLATMFRRSGGEIQHRFAFGMLGPDLVDRGVGIGETLVPLRQKVKSF